MKKLGRSEAYGVKTADNLGALSFAHRATVALGPAEGLKSLKQIDVGSGVLVSFAGRTFIATSAHYLDLVPLGEMTVVFPPDSQERAKDLTELKRKFAGTNWDDLNKAWPVNAKDHKRSDMLQDVAVIEIDPAMIPRNCWVYPLDGKKGKQPLPKPGQQVHITGLPFYASVIHREEPPKDGKPPSMGLGRVALQLMKQVINIPDPEEWRDEDGKPSFLPYHFAVSFDIDKVPSKILPGGLSGCGVWKSADEATSGGIHIPYPLLLGIENNHHKGRKALKVTRINKVIDLLKREARK